MVFGGTGLRLGVFITSAFNSTLETGCCPLVDGLCDLMNSILNMDIRQRREEEEVQNCAICWWTLMKATLVNMFIQKNKGVE